MTSLQTVFEGLFVTELAGLTPSDLQTLIVSGRSISASFSAEVAAGPFASTPSVPEPTTLALIAIAVSGALASRRRRPA